MKRNRKTINFDITQALSVVIALAVIMAGIGLTSKLVVSQIISDRGGYVLLLCINAIAIMLGNVLTGIKGGVRSVKGNILTGVCVISAVLMVGLFVPGRYTWNWGMPVSVIIGAALTCLFCLRKPRKHSRRN